MNVVDPDRDPGQGIVLDQGIGPGQGTGLDPETVVVVVLGTVVETAQDPER